ncbi:response regulator transcription factor [Lacticaseibacillus mingshuiensis]|uniref:response regulator transcription factor n=1 Tax=Lacticaseibacillus mingshuiensis TaxID=2799574 RepID=UPI0019524AE5|nr:response regulator transcription factor [Lacticaseibacillus mingshuiensis]
MQTILVVEDHEDIQALLKQVLSDQYQVAQAFSGSEALTVFDTAKPDLVLLDLMLPTIDGDSVLKLIRRHSQVPVIVLTAITDKQRTVALLKNGANDYLTKPFDIDELLARIQVQLRATVIIPETHLCFEAIDIDTATHTVQIAGHPLTLPKKEFAMLSLLTAHPHQVYNKQALYEAVWHEPFLNADNTLNVHLSNLRTKINDLAPEPHYIVSLWGIGVRLV